MVFIKNQTAVVLSWFLVFLSSLSLERRERQSWGCRNGQGWWYFKSQQVEGWTSFRCRMFAPSFNSISLRWSLMIFFSKSIWMNPNIFVDLRKKRLQLHHLSNPEWRKNYIFWTQPSKFRGISGQFWEVWDPKHFTVPCPFFGERPSNRSNGPTVQLLLLIYVPGSKVAFHWGWEKSHL